MWVIPALLDPDQDSESGSVFGATDLIESGSNLDPDLKFHFKILGYSSCLSLQCIFENVIGGVVLPAPLHLEVYGGRKDLPPDPGPGYAQPGGKLWHGGQEVTFISRVRIRLGEDLSPHPGSESGQSGALARRASGTF